MSSHHPHIAVPAPLYFLTVMNVVDYELVVNYTYSPIPCQQYFKNLIQFQITQMTFLLRYRIIIMVCQIPNHTIQNPRGHYV